jgi:hypothetical protein
MRWRVMCLGLLEGRVIEVSSVEVLQMQTKA